MTKKLVSEKKKMLLDGQYKECLLSTLRTSHSEEHAWFCSPLAEKDLMSLTFSLSYIGIVIKAFLGHVFAFIRKKYNLNSYIFP